MKTRGNVKPSGGSSSGSSMARTTSSKLRSVRGSISRLTCKSIGPLQASSGWNLLPRVDVVNKSLQSDARHGHETHGRRHDSLNR